MSTSFKRNMILKNTDQLIQEYGLTQYSYAYMFKSVYIPTIAYLRKNPLAKVIVFNGLAIIGLVLTIFLN